MSPSRYFCPSATLSSVRSKITDERKAFFLLLPSPNVLDDLLVPFFGGQCPPIVRHGVVWHVARQRSVPPSLEPKLVVPVQHQRALAVGDIEDRSRSFPSDASSAIERFIADSPLGAATWKPRCWWWGYALGTEDSLLKRVLHALV
jgi:hypothetical protein